jgi:hypothetical protein
MSKGTLLRVVVLLATLSAIWFVIAAPGGIGQY